MQLRNQLSEPQHGLHPLMTVYYLYFFKIDICSIAFWDRLGSRTKFLRSFWCGEHQEFTPIEAFTVWKKAHTPFNFTHSLLLRRDP